MSGPKIPLPELDRYLRAGYPQREIAQMFKVTEGAVSIAKRRLQKRTIAQAALERTPDVVKGHLNVMDQLRRINEVISGQLDQAEVELATASGRDRRQIQEIMVKLSGEIRRQLDAQLRIAELWHNAKIMHEFQQEVLAILDEMEPGARKRVIDRLKERRIIRESL